MKSIHSRYRILLIIGALWLPTQGQALTCQLDSFSSPNMGDITLATINSATTNQLLSYSCTNNSDTTKWVSVCIGADGGVNNPMQISPRRLTGPADSTLNFNMILTDRGNAIWGSRNNNGTEFMDFISVNPNTTTTRTTNIKTSLLPDNDLAIAGNYSAHFTSVNTALNFVTSDSNNDRQQCASTPQRAKTAAISFTIKATVLDSCYIKETSDITLGVHSASRTNITGFNSKAISMLCTNGSSYNIGLTPSNDNKNGLGSMKGSIGNPYEVTYQLQSAEGIGGAPWGNTADNRLTRRGDGMTQTETVYVTVPNVDVKADDYADVVTIKLYY